MIHLQMEGELIRDWSRLKVTEDEEVPIISPREIGGGENLKKKVDLMLVGKVFANKPPNIFALQNTLNSLWRIRESVVVRDLGNEVLPFQFFSKSDKLRVLDGRPWSSDNQLLLLQEVKGNEMPSIMEFRFTPIWIRVLDVPLYFRTLEFAMELGGRMAGFLEYDARDPLGWREAMRVRVMIDEY